MKRIAKLLISFSIIFAVFLTLGLSAYAASDRVLNKAEVTFDSPHGSYFYVENNKNMYLNMYTSGVPVSGTKVTTWSRIPGDPTQAWDHGTLADGTCIIIANNYTQLAIDFNRNYNIPEVQLYEWIGDYYDDVVIDYDMSSLQGNPIKLANRAAYLNVTDENTAVYDPYGKICVWSDSSSPTNWVRDISDQRKFMK